VVLACGGFEWNPEMIRGFIGYNVAPLSPPNNTGDGLVMAQELGAQLANMGSYWGTPAMEDPAIVDDQGRPVPQFEGGRGMPGSIVVNAHGQRFANEAMPYNDFPKAMGRYDPTVVEFPNERAWLVFDHQAKESVQILSMVPGQPAPDWVAQASTVRDLAGRLGLDPEALEATVERFNKFAAAGEDPDFGRDHLGLMGVAPLRPIDQGPFYALPMKAGALGTNGGPKVDVDGRVLGRDGAPLVGLYAVGNTAASAFGWSYPSGGATIGHGVVFGYRAGRHVAAQPPVALG
jgi:succinate dehydrogenase/fumarate reductase flavoprotein subunit